MGLVSELRRRNVLRMAVLYAVAAWLVMQVAEVILTLAALPDWLGQLILVLLVVGFPIALIFSWFYELTPEGLSLEKEVAPGESVTHITGRRIEIIVISLLSAAVLLFAVHTWWPWSQAERPNTPDGAIGSIAVLPLQNLSNDPAQEYFVEGMQDALITSLSRMTELRVISKTSTLRYQATDKSIPEISRELNVDALIEGSVLRDQDRIRITAKLIKGAEDTHVWANSYDRDLDQILALTSEIALAIAEEINVTVKQQPEERAQRNHVDFAVHELVLQGDFLFNRFRFDQSLAHYQQAIDKAADYAPAHGGMAGSYLLKAYFGMTPGSESIPKAREAALKAISLDSNSSRGYATLGAIQLYYDWDWDLAKTNLLRSLALAPNDASTRHVYADYLLVMGDLDESLHQVEIGHLYDPFSPMANRVLDGHRIFAQQYDEVIEKGRKASAENPDSGASLIMYQEALWLSGLKEEAVATYKKTWGKNEELLHAINTGYSESGYTGAVLFLANALAERGDFIDYVTIAELYARAGEPGLAMDWLEKAYQHHQPRILHITASPTFNEMRSSAAFQDLVRRVGFPQASQQSSAGPERLLLAVRGSWPSDTLNDR